MIVVVRYCLDTSWISNPILDMPPDIHVTLWDRILDLLHEGVFCWNEEIWDEINGAIVGAVGDSLADCNGTACRIIGDESWPWQVYLDHVERVRGQYRQFISEYNGNRKNTVGLNDCSIVCLAKTLDLPVASMERRSLQPSQKRMRIPELCEHEDVRHFDLNELLRNEGITV